MRKSVQRAAVEDVISVERPLRIFIRLISLARFKRLLAAFRIRSNTPAANRMSANLKDALRCIKKNSDSAISQVVQQRYLSISPSEKKISNLLAEVD